MVGNYTLGKKLGRGSFCKVRVVTHNVTGVKYAMKIMKPTDRKNNSDDLEREIRVLSNLRHPHIVGLHDVLYADETNKVVVGTVNSSLQHARKLYLVVDLASNGELFDYIISKRKISEDEARWFFRQIISAVEYLHAHCIAHRDLKPENILLDAQNSIKLNDFGLSNFVQPEKKMKTFCGSPVYAAPEVMRKSYYDGVVADVWSLGVILFTMVTGCLPWKLDAHTNRIENIDDLLAGRFDIPVAVSPECTALLHKMLVPDPSQRTRLNQIRKHPWVNKGYMDYPPRFLEPNKPVMDIDKVVLRQMETMGFMQARVCQDVLSNKAKPAVTIYHTLLKRRTMQLLVNATPATRSAPASPTKSPHSPHNSPRSPKGWTPMEIVYEEPAFAPPRTPPTISPRSHSPPSPVFPQVHTGNSGSPLPTTRSGLSRWIKEMTKPHPDPNNGLPVPGAEINLRTSVAIMPTTPKEPRSSFLKRRHSLPETQDELRTLAYVNTSTKKEKGILQRLFSRAKRAAVGVAIPA